MGEGGPLPLKKARLSDLVGPFCLPFLASVFASCVTAIGYVGLGTMSTCYPPLPEDAAIKAKKKRKREEEVVA